MSGEKPRAKDLSKEEPAPMYATLAGYPWLPRIIDKARASAAGTLGDYYKYPCPIDQQFLESLGVDANAFREIASGLDGTEEIVETLLRAGATPASDFLFDPERVFRALHPGSDYPPGRPQGH